MRVLSCLFALTLVSASVAAVELDVKDAWVRGTVPGQRASGAFMTLTSPHNAVLVGATVSDKIAGVAEIHEMKMEGDRMLMRAIPRLELPAGKPVVLASGGYHVMLMDLKQPLKAGEHVTLELKIETAAKKVETVKVKAEVRGLSGEGGHGHHHH